MLHVGYIECEPPNNRLHKFVGTLHWNKEDYALDNDKIVLRGCRLRNTKWMYGVVIYAGHDTKLVQNSGKFTVAGDPIGILVYLYNVRVYTLYIHVYTCIIIHCTFQLSSFSLK